MKKLAVCMMSVALVSAALSFSSSASAAPQEPPDSRAKQGATRITQAQAQARAFAREVREGGLPQRLEEYLRVRDDGTLELVTATREAKSSLGLSPEETENLSQAIRMVNVAVGSGNLPLGADPEALADSLALASKGYWECVAKVLKCEAESAGCLTAAPACAYTCANVCAGTVGFGCISCVVACTGGAVALCDAAYDCWVEARAEGCVP